ncbi:hypothetical protein A2U01_0035364, partial [Trifolium medium]|nr:hypothetical protein [Trifolium medium]
DSWLWKHDPSGYYSVKSAFLALSRSTSDEVIFSVEEERIGCQLVKISGSGASLGMLVLLRVCYVDYGMNQPITYLVLVTKSH